MVLLLLEDFIGGASKRPRLEDYFILNPQRAESRPYFQICPACKFVICRGLFFLRPNSKTLPLNTQFVVS
jgi:hypothetical protein